MSTRPTTSEAVAEVLRESPPRLDDVARARIEARVMGVRREDRAPRSRGAWIAAGIASAAAIAAAVLLYASWPHEHEREPAPIARFERFPSGASMARGTLEEGSTLETSSAEVADVRVRESRVHLEPGSRVRLIALAPARVQIELDRGAVQIEFHPRVRGREHLTVETTSARVEVVGTVFRVRVDGAETSVGVTEGVVRVVPLESGPARLVHAGERTSVVRAAASAERASPGHVETPTAPAQASSGPIDSPAIDAPPDPELMLAQARRLAVDWSASRQTLDLLARVIDLRPRARVRTEAWTLTADVRRRDGDLQGAAQAYEEAAQAGRGTLDGESAIYALARLQDRELHDLGAARASYERYLRETPDGALAEQVRARLCELGATERCGEVP